MVTIFRIIKNWQSAQWSALYSPAGFGDRLNENAQAWINKKKRNIEPDNAAVSSLGVAFAPYFDEHEYLKTAIFVTIAFLTLWFTDWGYLAFHTRNDSNDLNDLTQDLWTLFLMIAFTNTLTLIAIGLETKRSLLKTILRLPAALIITTPICFIPSLIICMIIYNGTLLLPHPQQVAFPLNHATTWKAAFYYSLFSDKPLLDALLDTSRTLKARPFITHVSTVLEWAMFSTFPFMYMICGLFMMSALYLVGLEPGPRYFEVGCYLILIFANYSVYALAKQFHHTHEGFQLIIALRQQGKEIPDRLEAEAILKMNFKPDEPIDNKIAHDVLNQKLGIDSPFYLHGPIKPIEGLDDGGYWDNFYYGRVPPLKREEAS